MDSELQPTPLHAGVTPSRIAAYNAAMAAARVSLARSMPSHALVQLERAHVLGQRDLVRHWRVHLMMLRSAWAAADARELRGQVFRLLLVPLGHLLRRLPRGDTGRSNVNAFTPMDMPADLKQLLENDHG